MSEINTIREGGQVIIRRGNTMKSMQVRRDRQVYMEKFKFGLAGVIGFAYGTTFEVKQGKLVPTCHEDSKDVTGEIDQIRDNRNLEDKRANQALSREDILSLRKEGASGQEIVDQLVENSATFKEKTDFAQQKYIKKKKKKHLAKFTFLRPTTRLLAEMYFNRGPAKICNLRLDSLAQMLTQGNVRAHSKLLVVETCNGLLLGGVMERLGGFGSVVQLYSGFTPVRPALESLDLPKDHLSILRGFPLNCVSSLNRPGHVTTSKVDLQESPKSDSAAVVQASEPTETESSTKTEVNEEASAKPDSPNNTGALDSDDGMEVNDDDSAHGPMEQDLTPCDTVCDNSDDKAARWKSTGKKRRVITEDERTKRRELKQKEIQEVKQIIEAGNMDGLLVASKFHPTPIVLSLLDFIGASRPIVVFSQYKEPLLDCYKKLRDHGGVVSLKLTETWLRNHQVLPNRTHPNIMMSGNSGYLLACTTVVKKLDQKKA